MKIKEVEKQIKIVKEKYEEKNKVQEQNYNHYI